MNPPDKEAVRWAYRLFLDREPENDDAVARPFVSIPALRDSFLGSLEYRNKNVAMQLSHDTWVIKETVHGFRIWLAIAELGVSRPILNDAYDSRETAAIKGLVREGDTCIDIGANIGFYSLLLATLVGPRGRVIGFEPLKQLHEKAVLSVEENGYESFCQIHRLALSNQAGTLGIRHAPLTTNFGGGHLAPDSPTPRDHVDEIVSVVKLDDFMPETRVSFIKMDIEGAEPLALAGGAGLLARDRPAILSELHNLQLKSVSGSSATAVIRQLATLNYVCYAIDDPACSHPLTAYESDVPINVLFIAKS